jgi:hypothetical protein
MRRFVLRGDEALGSRLSALGCRLSALGDGLVLGLT